MDTAHTAFLSNTVDMTVFTFQQTRIRFRTSRHLIRYERVKEWDHGYLVVDANYDTLGVTEEYIDLIPVLENLMFDVDAFLDPIREVQLQYAESGQDCRI